MQQTFDILPCHRFVLLTKRTWNSKSGGYDTRGRYSRGCGETPGGWANGKEETGKEGDVEEASEGPQMESVQFGILENVETCEKSKRRGEKGKWRRQSASRPLFMTRT